MKKAVLGALAAALVMKLFLFDFVIAEGESMSPAIASGKVLLVNRLKYGIRLPWQDRYLVRWAAPRRGDIVVFRTPLGGTAVKRVAETLDGNRFIALGDNSRLSLDSRNYGPASADLVLGKVVGAR